MLFRGLTTTNGTCCAVPKVRAFIGDRAAGAMGTWVSCHLSGKRERAESDLGMRLGKEENMSSARVMTGVAGTGPRKRSKYLVFRLENLDSALEAISAEDTFQVNSSAGSNGASMPESCGWDMPIADSRSGAGADARSREGDKEDESERYFIITVETEAHHSRSAIGLVVDRVAEILDFGAESCESTAENKPKAAPVSRNAGPELRTAKILDLDGVLPVLARFGHRFGGLDSGCTS